MLMCATVDFVFGLKVNDPLPAPLVYWNVPSPPTKHVGYLLLTLVFCFIVFYFVFCMYGRLLLRQYWHQGSCPKASLIVLNGKKVK